MTMMAPPPGLCPDPQTLRALIGAGPSIASVAQALRGVAVTGAMVERVHFPGAKPVQVQIRVSAADGSNHTLIGEWQGAAAVDMAMAEAARLAKPRRGQAGDLSVVADLASGLVLRRPGFDARLPGLRLLHDHDWAKAQMPVLGCDPGAEVTLVAHRLGKRAVLRISGAHGTRYARLRPVTSGSGQAAFGMHQALWSALQAAPTDLSVPRPISFDATLGLALFDALPGSPPVFQGLAGFVATQKIMRALHALQALPIAPTDHSAQDELDVLATWSQRVADTFPDLAQRLQAPLSRLRKDMEHLRPLPPVPCHRDLHEGQILLTDAGAGLLDFDTLRTGDPALDVGNLQAHLVLASLRDGLLRGAFVTAMGNAMPQLSLARMGVWRRAALLRLAMIYAFSATPTAVINGLIQKAECDV
jgi:hypothetical protein